jgi:hypothetical protein
MRLFQPVPVEDSELAHPVNAEDFEAFVTLVNGEERSALWTPIQMKVVRTEYDGRPFSYSDAPWLGSHALVFRAEAIAALRTILDAHGELLPLVCEDAALWAFNATRVISALDEEHSELWRFDSGRIMHVERYAFNADAVLGVDMFKIPQLRACPTFVSESVVRAWTSSGLRGLEFKPIWDGAPPN